MKYDALVIGAGPNGLSAAVELARSGVSVCLLEASETIGGGTRSGELTLPGYVHDICSAIHPMAFLSPFFRSLKLQIDWIFPPAALAHPLADGSAAVLFQDLRQTAAGLNGDRNAWQRMFEPFVERADHLFSEILKPPGVPRYPFLMAEFGFLALRSARSLAQSRFAQPLARALFTGCAAHSLLSLNRAGSAAFGLLLALAGHASGWPLAKEGSQQIANALGSAFQSSGGEIQTGRFINSMRDLPEARAYLFDVTPKQLLQIASEDLPTGYRRKLESYRYGPGVYKMDWALSGPIPWKSSECALAATVHVGGTMEEVAQAEEEVVRGRHPDRPFLLLGQQSLFDSTRAPEGKHTGWAYCHVPNGSNIDMTERIENQIERFAPGFRDLILARHTYNCRQLEEHNANLIGGDISGGANDLYQLLARPVLKLNPYATANPKIFLCSSSTPPGGGVHGMCGYHAARSALKNVFGL
jgi:phytoene dehydrogenase-like protein